MEVRCNLLACIILYHEQTPITHRLVRIPTENAPHNATRHKTDTPVSSPDKPPDTTATFPPFL